MYAVGLIVNRRHHGDGGAQGNGGRKDEWPGRKDRIGRGGGAVCLFECGAVYICQWAAGAQPGESGRNAVSACKCPFIMPSGNYCLGVPRRTPWHLLFFPLAMRHARLFGPGR